MAKETNNTSPSLQELLEEMKPCGKYNHLQIILSKKKDHRMGQKYLVISPTGFAVYQLLNVDYNDGAIQMKLMDTNTGKIAHVNQNINDDAMHLILICWSDIVSMVKKDNAKMLLDNELLDFDY